jgi:cysteine desulfurase / selenocysteine lyase
MSQSPSLVYLDHAATSFPKPSPVIEAMSRFLTHKAINPGRSGYDLAIQASQEIDQVREDLGHFFGNQACDLNHTIFTANATDALNLAISGLCRQGDHVVTTTLEHNSVLRPLHMMAEAGIIKIDIVPCDDRGFINPEAIAAAIRENTRLVVMTHASNVVGSIQPLEIVGPLCRKRNVTFLVDAAQTAGALPLNMEACNIDMVAFTGHKSFQASPGIGGLILGSDVDLKSTRWGGTGVRSAQLTQPQELPYRLESGTLNGAGIMSLKAGLEWVQSQGMENLLHHERELVMQFVEGCTRLSRITLQGHGQTPENAVQSFRENTHMPIVSLTVDGMDPAAVGMFLDVDWNIAVRTGLHCAPLIHKSLGTYDEGSVRFSFGPGNTENDVEKALSSLAALP